MMCCYLNVSFRAKWLIKQLYPYFSLYLFNYWFSRSFHYLLSIKFLPPLFAVSCILWLEIITYNIVLFSFLLPLSFTYILYSTFPFICTMVPYQQLYFYGVRYLSPFLCHVCPSVHLSSPCSALLRSQHKQCIMPNTMNAVVLDRLPGHKVRNLMTGRHRLWSQANKMTQCAEKLWLFAKCR